MDSQRSRGAPTDDRRRLDGVAARLRCRQESAPRRSQSSISWMGSPPSTYGSRRAVSGGRRRNHVSRERATAAATQTVKKVSAPRSTSRCCHLSVCRVIDDLLSGAERHTLQGATRSAALRPLPSHSATAPWRRTSACPRVLASERRSQDVLRSPRLTTTHAKTACS